MQDLVTAMRGMAPAQAQQATQTAANVMLSQQQMAQQQSMLDQKFAHEIYMAEQERMHQELANAARQDLEERKFQLEQEKAEIDGLYKFAQTEQIGESLMKERRINEMTTNIFDVLDQQGPLTTKFGYAMNPSQAIFLENEYGVDLIPDDVGIDMGIHKAPDGSLMWIHRRPGEREPTTYNLAAGASEEAANDIRRLALDFLGADSFSGLKSESQFQFLNIVSVGTQLAGTHGLSAVEAFTEATVATERFDRVWKEVAGQLEAAKSWGRLPKVPDAAQLLASPPYEGEQSVLDFFFQYDLEPTVLEDQIVRLGYSRKEASDIIALAVRQYQTRSR